VGLMQSNLKDIKNLKLRLFKERIPNGSLLSYLPFLKLNSMTAPDMILNLSAMALLLPVIVGK
jgi:hypothetical protein